MNERMNEGMNEWMKENLCGRNYVIYMLRQIPVFLTINDKIKRVSLLLNVILFN